MKRLIAIVAALAALSGCATFSHAQRPANLYEAAQQIVSSTGAVVARAAHSAGRYGATFGATGGSEVGSFPNAAPLNGSERILADQNATTVNLTPAQIAQYLGIPSGLIFPLSVANGGTGTATPGLVAGSNITITGSWPDQTIASTGGATPGGSSGSIQWNNGGVLAGLSVGAGQILQGGTTPSATSTPTLGASGTLGTLTLGNATSGTETIAPPTGALGTLTITLPGTSGTLALTSGNVATATALATTPTTCSATQAATGILANGNATGCFTPSGSGTMTDGAGTTTANELVLSSTTAHAYTNATTLPTAAMPAMSGDCTSSAGSTSLTCSKVNGAIPTASAPIAATNSLSQIIAATTTGTGSTAVLATSPSLTTPLVAGYATASLPTCNSASKGALAYTTDGTPAFTFCNGTSWVSAGGTTFTVAGTGCTPTAATGSATAGTFTLAAGPCTAVTVTFNGAVGMTAPNGWHCDVGDRTLQAAGTWWGEWPENSSTTTTATIGIPAAAGTTDVISFHCTEF